MEVDHFDLLYRKTMLYKYNIINTNVLLMYIIMRFIAVDELILCI